MDIGDAEFTDLTNYRFAIDAVPEWSGGSTAILTDRVLCAVPDADAAVDGLLVHGGDVAGALGRPPSESQGSRGHLWYHRRCADPDYGLGNVDGGVDGGIDGCV